MLCWASACVYIRWSDLHMWQVNSCKLIMPFACIFSCFLIYCLAKNASNMQPLPSFADKVNHLCVLCYTPSKSLNQNRCNPRSASLLSTSWWRWVFSFASATSPVEPSTFGGLFDSRQFNAMLPEEGGNKFYVAWHAINQDWILAIHHSHSSHPGLGCTLIFDEVSHFVCSLSGVPKACMVIMNVNATRILSMSKWHVGWKKLNFRLITDWSGWKWMYTCHLTHDCYDILEHWLNLKNISYLTQF